ncbi:uncharacterized protein Tco025E_03433 [Trypanosoma conorhini]|uniref:Uncharacterized protein n=1 Tax=Trypanosoma conorhini TaxID=83891 RepID=A0A3R7S4S7_9TRYP|nr:uncharacterized protein Tco025E_03433 [Trypanosoma conorhini]RNF21353.1 hypothetical protein Tco025E_03433 [Trypanosoma conorhini]
MTEVPYSPCPIFPGEVEDYYCTSCHTTCSGLSLLVGPHTGHNRVPLAAAVQYLPAALQRDARALVTRIQEEYVRPKAAHCDTLHATLAHMQQERQRKRRQVEELQRELGGLDEKIDALTEECAMALCHWSHQREGFLRQVRRLLQGGDAIARTLATRVKGTRDPHRGGKVGAARQAANEELHELQRLLAQPLAWLEQEEDAAPAAPECSKEWQELQSGPPATADGGAVFGQRNPQEYSCRQIRGVSGLRRRGNDRRLGPSDAEAVLEQLLAEHREPLTQPHTRRASSPSSAATSTVEEDGASSCGAPSEASAGTEQRRRRRDFKWRERLLREGLDRCMFDGPSVQRGPTKNTADDETGVNYTSGSSGSGSVREAVVHLLRDPQRR